ncbi:TauD/TfdA family dioxygenase [Frankia sp. Cr1]|uniref:TauD/TfdA family dioxygenase n=1 Tax=Frankia sp. Cr1 TaxID=3073931 RepID=UPI002AD1D3B5|nr:TauD/TfdA family dioxygenase [Frankia sp. Cr1]
MTTVLPPAILTALGVRPHAAPFFHPDTDLTPVRLSGYTQPTFPERMRLLTRLSRAGFVVFTVDEEPTSARVCALAGRLGLGAAFVPPLYQPNPAAADRLGISRLTVSASTGPTPHPAFEATDAQPFHTDGTLQHLGEVPISILACHTPAASGGQSLLFNATGALAVLADTDPPAAAALMTPGVLVRTATINHCMDMTSGPAFAIDDGRLLSRYSITATDRWNPDAVTDPAAFHRALAFLTAAGSPGSPHRLELRLPAGHGLLFANDRISHGRAAYSDNPTAPRIMLRGLFRHRPTLTAGGDRDA